MPLIQHKLVAVVCGIPFSGTTYLSRIITSHPSIESGFECGLLFGKTPADFPTKSNKFYNWMMSLDPPYNWKLTQKEMDDICSSASFYESYRKIVDYCHLFNDQQCFVIDKTPAYVHDLTRMMRKVPDTPVVIVKKDLYYQYYSYKKRGRNIHDFIKVYSKFKASIERAQNLPLKKRILVIQYEDLVNFQGKSYMKIFKFLKKFNPELEFDSEMVKEMSKKLNQDIVSNKKKLRKRFDLNKEIEACKIELSETELSMLEKIEEIQFA